MQLEDWVKLSKGLKCPSCDDTGSFPVPSDYGGWEQQQCEFCWTCPESIFRRLKDEL